MKKNKGFTLIELLAVIVILAIIALIAVPVVMNIINRANKSAFKDSAYGLLKAGELFYTDQLLENAGLAQETTFTFPNNIEGLEFKGSKPSKGSMTVNKDGKIAMAITNGKYCVTKGFDDEDVVIKEDDGKCKLPGYNLGDIVYYNPNEAKVCTEAEWNNNADKNGKTGCMRWYVYAINGSTPKLILDHNTTNKVAWISKEDYVAAGGTEEQYGYYGDNAKGAITLMKQLKEDTENQGWKIKADIITSEEVADLIPYYQNLSAGDKQAFLNPIEENSTIYENYINEIGNAFDEAGRNIDFVDVASYMKALNEYVAENYGELMLPKYIYGDMVNSCGEDPDAEATICDSWGYWTKTASSFSSSEAWTVHYDGKIVRADVFVGWEPKGLRPVITLSK